jgi:hypothetical protein
MTRSTALDANAIAPGSLVVSAVAGIALATGGFVVGIGATSLAAGTTSFWYLSRATGFVAYLLLWGSVTWGLLSARERAVGGCARRSCSTYISSSVPSAWASAAFMASC